MKRWDDGALYDQPDVITNRMRLIESASSQIAVIPETHFEWQDGILLQRQRRIPSAVTLSALIRRSDKLPTPETLYTFAKEVDRMHQLGLTHWDFKPTNICFDGVKLYLIDWEPSLLQYRSGKLTMIVTPEYVAPSERGGPIPTALSDRFGWIKTLLLLGLRNETLYDLDGYLTKRSFTSAIDERIEECVQSQRLGEATLSFTAESPAMEHTSEIG